MPKKYPGIVLKPLALSLLLAFNSVSYATPDSNDGSQVEASRWYQISQNRDRAQAIFDHQKNTPQHSPVSFNELHQVKVLLQKDVKILRSAITFAGERASVAWRAGINQLIDQHSLSLDKINIEMASRLSSHSTTEAHSGQKLSAVAASRAEQRADKTYCNDPENNQSVASQEERRVAPSNQKSSASLSQRDRPDLSSYSKNNMNNMDDLSFDVDTPIDRLTTPRDKYQATAEVIAEEQKQIMAKKRQSEKEKLEDWEIKIAANKDRIEILPEYIERIRRGEAERSNSDSQRQLRIAIREREKRNIEKWLAENEPQFNKAKKDFYAREARLQQYELNDKQYQPFLSEVLVRKANPSFYQINKPYASELKGFEGQSVTIGVIDHGFQVHHPQFFDKKIRTYNAYNGNKDVDRNDEDHGSMVAAIAAGELALVNPPEFDDNRDLRRQKGQRVPLMSETEGRKYFEGVAHGAKLALVDPHGGTKDWKIAQSINWLVNDVKAQIINFSADTAADWHDSTVDALKRAMDKGTLFIASAGNKDLYGLLWPGKYAKESWANQIDKGAIIMVGSVDENNQISSFSNVPSYVEVVRGENGERIRILNKELAKHFVVAPGENITSATKASAYKTADGTSFASPQVAGQAALIKDRWPFLSGNEIAQIIFKTAKHLGESKEGEPDAIYGWGLIDVRRSLQPVGSLQVTMADGSKVDANQMSLGSLSGPIGSSVMVAAQQGTFAMVGLDDFRRDFSVDVGKTAQLKPSGGISQQLNDESRKPFYGRHFLDGNGSYLSYTGHMVASSFDRATLLGYQPSQTIKVLNNMHVVQRFGSNNELMASIGSAYPYFGLASHHIAGSSELTGAAFNDAYSKLLPVASSIGVGRQFAHGLNMKLNLATTRFSNVFSHQYQSNMTWQNALSSERNETNLARLEVSKRLGKSVLSLAASRMGEKNSLLGTSMGMGFGLNEAAKTYVTTLSAAHQLSEDVTLTGYFSQGMTPSYDNKASSLTHISGVRSQAYGVGMVLNNYWKATDRLALGISSPLAVSGGTMTFDLPIAVNAQGHLVREKRQIALFNPAREYLFELNYAAPVTRYSRLSLAFSYRQNADNVRGKAEQTGMINYRWER